MIALDVMVLSSCHACSLPVGGARRIEPHLSAGAQAARREPCSATHPSPHPALACGRPWIARRDGSGQVIGVEHAQIHGSLDGETAPADAELAIDVRLVPLDGVDRHEQPPGDLPGRRSPAQQPEQLDLTAGEPQVVAALVASLRSCWASTSIGRSRRAISGRSQSAAGASQITPSRRRSEAIATARRTRPSPRLRSPPRSPRPRGGSPARVQTPGRAARASQLSHLTEWVTHQQDVQPTRQRELVRCDPLEHQGRAGGVAEVGAPARCSNWQVRLDEWKSCGVLRQLGVRWLERRHHRGRRPVRTAVGSSLRRLFDALEDCPAEGIRSR